MNQPNLNGSHLTIRSNASPFETVDRSTSQLQQSPVPVQVQQPSRMPDYGSLLQLSDTLTQQNNILAQSNAGLQHSNIALSAELSKVQNQNFSLQGRIAQLQKKRAETTRSFNVNIYGVISSHEPNGKSIEIGRFNIVKFNIYILEDSNEEAYYEILYSSWEQNKIYSTFVPESAVSKQSLTVYFAHFVVSPSCSKKLANLFLYYAIRQKLQNMDSVNYIPLHAGFTTTANSEITFISNANCPLPPDLTPPSIKSRNLLPTEREAAEIWKDIEPTFQNPVLCLLHAFRVAGILSTVLAENNLVMQQILSITSNSNKATVLAPLYLKVFNRPNLRMLPLDATKHQLTEYLQNAKDETVLLSDIASINNEKKRDASISVLLEDLMNISMSDVRLPHNIAVVSNAAAYLIPEEYRIVLHLDDDLCSDMDQDTIAKNSRIFEEFDSYLIRAVCSSYDHYKNILADNKALNDCKVIVGEKSALTLRIIWNTLTLISLVFREWIPIDEICEYLVSILEDSSKICSNNGNGILNEFAGVLNRAICSRRLGIMEHSKDMKFIPCSGIVILKEDLLILEEDSIRRELLPNMTITQSLSHLLKALAETGTLHSTKKHRFPLTVYDKYGNAKRMDFIAMYAPEVLNAETEEFLKINKHPQFFSDYLPDTFLPLIQKPNGKVAGMDFQFERSQNCHTFVTGMSGSGKSVFLCQLCYNKMKLGNQVVIFDTDCSFTREALCQNLSEHIVDEYVTFHDIAENGLPVDLFAMPGIVKRVTQKNTIAGILIAGMPSLSDNQISVLKNMIIAALEQNSSFDICDLMEILEDEEGNTVNSLNNKLLSIFEEIAEYGGTPATWDEFLGKSAGITVISLKSPYSEIGHQLMDMLMSSLYFHQIEHGVRQLSIFIDEIQNQNLSKNGPIAKILKEGRKFHIDLNYATQTVSKSNSEVNKILDQASTSVFFRPDDISESIVTHLLKMGKKESAVLGKLKPGECFVKSFFYDFEQRQSKPIVLCGKTYLPFVKFEE